MLHPLFMMLALTALLSATVPPSDPTILNGDIVFAAKQDGDYEIFVMEADGTDMRQLTFNAVDEYYPVWSPTGNAILFTRSVDMHLEIFRMYPDGSHILSLTPGLNSRFGQWSPDGTKIAFTVSYGSGYQDVYVMDADGSNKTNVTNDPKTYINDRPMWSNDGEYIYFLTDRAYPPSSALDPVVTDVYRMRADGSDPTHVFGMGINFKGMQLSPADEEQLVYGVATLDSAIFIRNLTNSDEIMLIDGIESFGAYPAWSPDGSKIAFVRDGPTISTIELDGTNLVDLRTFDGLRGIRDLDWLGLPSIVPTR